MGKGPPPVNLNLTTERDKPLLLGVLAENGSASQTLVGVGN